MRSVLQTVFAACLIAAGALSADAAARQYLAYVGSYGDAIVVFRFDPGTGKLALIGPAAETPQPSWITIHPDGRYLYSANEVPNGQGAVSAFSIDAGTGKLAFLNKVDCKGVGPCHLAVDKSGRMLTVTNYETGSVAVMPVRGDGSLGQVTSFFQHGGTDPKSGQPQIPHTHSANISPDNRFVIIADKGLNRLFTYRLDPANATMTPGDPPFSMVTHGTAPRHFVFSPDARFGYSLNETAGSITAMSYNPSSGALSEIQTISTVPADYTSRNTGAEIAIGADGRFIYSSNRRHDSIAVFRRDPEKGTLARIQNAKTGRTPRSFGIDPTGRYMLVGNQGANSISVFRIDAKTGELTPTGEEVPSDAPVCLQFVPAQ